MEHTYVNFKALAFRAAKLVSRAAKPVPSLLHFGAACPALMYPIRNKVLVDGNEFVHISTVERACPTDSVGTGA